MAARRLGVAGGAFAASAVVGWVGCGAQWSGERWARSKQSRGVMDSLHECSPSIFKVASARGTDSANYLIPYYLKSVRSRFTHFATEKGTKGEPMMNSNDFIHSLVLGESNSRSFHVGSLDELFKTVDANSDGLISLSEYSLFMALLTHPLRRFEILFKMYDFNGSGTIDHGEFMAILRTTVDKEVKIPAKTGLVKFFFPEEGSTLNFEEFMTFLRRLRHLVTRAEFSQYDPNETGAITVENFSKLITASLMGAHVPFYIVDNLRRYKSKSQKDGKVPFSAWESFTEMLNISDELGDAIRMYTVGGHNKLEKKDFIRAVKAVSSHKLTEAEVDLVFLLFDRDGDGGLEYEEFLALMSNRSNFNSSTTNDPTKKHLNPIQALFECVNEKVRG